MTNDDVITGLEIKRLVSHGDSRGFFREIVRSTDSLFRDGEFGQWSHSKMVQDVVKAWHFHHRQFDWWYVPIGLVRAVFIDNRDESPTYRAKVEVLMGESAIQKSHPELTSHSATPSEVCVRIPPGVLHGCRVISTEAHLFYITSQTYNPEDEGRLPFNAPEIEFDWGPDSIVADNDRRYFWPTGPRSPA